MLPVRNKSTGRFEKQLKENTVSDKKLKTPKTISEPVAQMSDAENKLAVSVSDADQIHHNSNTIFDEVARLENNFYKLGLFSSTPFVDYRQSDHEDGAEIPAMLSVFDNALSTITNRLGVSSPAPFLVVRTFAIDALQIASLVLSRAEQEFSGSDEPVTDVSNLIARELSDLPGFAIVENNINDNASFFFNSIENVGGLLLGIKIESFLPEEFESHKSSSTNSLRDHLGGVLRITQTVLENLYVLNLQIEDNILA